MDAENFQNRREWLNLLDALQELALDVRWAWNHSADKLWSQLDPDLWKLTRNPWIVLQTISKAKLKEALANPKITQIVNSLMEAKRTHQEEETWFQKYHSKTLSCIAYFSMEFMLSEALPIYSGGLGNVAGDQLKAASDLGVPVIGIGLLYSQGYFRQIIDKQGNQQAFFPYNEPGQLPISPLRTQSGEWLRVKIAFLGATIWLRAWEVVVGRTKLYLLDSNDAANYPAHRGITSELYGGNQEMRIKQEILLGIGGWRLLQTLQLKPDVCHLNEGHAAFVVLERARSWMEATGKPFETALAATRPGNIFTTHTPVPEGFDWFSPDLMKDYLGVYAEKRLKIPLEALLDLGREKPGGGYFNMAYLAIRGSGAVNGVSQLHGKVSRALFQELFPRWPTDEVPIGAVTNGIHAPSWDSPEADELWTTCCGKHRWLETTEELEQKIKSVPDEKIWKMRESARNALVNYARERLVFQLEGRGAPPEEVERSKTYLDPQWLTLGFARRFAPYKRPNLLLSDPDRLLRILTNKDHPVQLILAGKAHPKDTVGQALIKHWMEFIFNNEKARKHVVFLSDYDMLLTEHLVQGADVWINTPKKPREACGTSGMKILVNGGLNLSELDGWWAEGYSPEVGWALDDGTDEADILYMLLEQQIVPEFYQNRPAWIGKIRESMARLTPFYSANRTVREYTERYYIPAAEKYHARKAQEIVDWKHSIERNWDKVRFGNYKVENLTFSVEVFLGDLRPEDVKVELFANDFKQEMKREGNLYSTTLSSYRAADQFTPRIIPFHPDVAVPLELSLICWQR